MVRQQPVLRGVDLQVSEAPAEGDVFLVAEGLPPEHENGVGDERLVYSRELRVVHGLR